MGGDHGQGAFQLPMQILYIMNTGKNHASIQPVGYILYKKYNDIILKNTNIKDFGDSANLLIKSMIFNNQHIYIYIHPIFT